MKRFLSLMLFLALALLPMTGLARGEKGETEENPVIQSAVTEISKYGNMILSIPGSDLLAQGYDFGDMLKVTIAGKVYRIPIGDNYADVDSGSMICLVTIREETGEDWVSLAVNMGSMANAVGAAVKETREDDIGYAWIFRSGFSLPIPVTLELEEKGGYYDQWVMHHLMRSENREDYPDLTDAEFANFRMIRMGGIAPERLYRSSSPVDPDISRNRYADRAAEEAGIRTIINLTDSEEAMRGFEGYSGSYYSGQHIIALNLGMEYESKEFRTGLARGLRFMLDHEGPYLLHCGQGRNRTGFVAAVLECLMGASEGEIVDDYMQTFRNYYGVMPGSEEYEVIAGNNIRRMLCNVFGVEAIDGADLRFCAENYLVSAGLSPEEIGRLRDILSQ